MKKSFYYYSILFLKGILMGIADIVPGVSGGTIAFIAGLYEDLLAGLKSINLKNCRLFFRGDFKEALELIHWKFLCTLGLGISVSFVFLAHSFQILLNHPIYSSFLYAFFLGLILASIHFCANEIKKWNFKLFIALFIGVVLAFFLTNVKKETHKEGLYIVRLSPSLSIDETLEVSNYNREIHALTDVAESMLQSMVAKQVIDLDDYILDQKTLKPFQVKQLIAKSGLSHVIKPWHILCGTIAICAMLLPGISGSYLLTVLGMYPIAIGALADFTVAFKNGSFDAEAFFILANISIGILIGLLLFARVVSWLLKNYHDLTIAALVGFMIGALKSVWPFWEKQLILNPLKPSGIALLKCGKPLLPLNDSLFWPIIGVVLLGFIIVFSLEKMARLSRH